MIFFDTIIYKLQKYGGITVYANEILKRLESKKIVHNTSFYKSENISKNNTFKNINFLERYRSCHISSETKIFHSTYYRTPILKVPAIVTVYDFIYERYANRIKRTFHSMQKMRAIQSAQEIICISESTKEDLLHFMPEIDPNKIHVVYCGVSESFRPLNTYGPCKDKNYVLFIGGRAGYKNFEFMVKAFSKFDDLSLVIVGGGLLSKTENLFLEKYISGRYIHYNHVSEKKLNNLYNNAFCLIYPSEYEGFGIPIVEAMRAGCPVIAINNSSIPEVAGNATVMLSKSCTEELRSGIEFLRSSTNRKNIIVNGFRQARNFSWDRTFEETYKIYEKYL